MLTIWTTSIGINPGSIKDYPARLTPMGNNPRTSAPNGCITHNCKVEGKKKTKKGKERKQPQETLGEEKEKKTEQNSYGRGMCQSLEY